MGRCTVSHYGQPEHFILHLSDTHFVGSNSLLYDTVDSKNHLQQMLNGIKESGARPEAIVFTGDLADEGDARAYEQLRELVDPVADELGATVIWVMGNHDNRASFRAKLLDESPSTKPVDHVYFLNGLRIIALDSTVPGAHYGEISPDQLAWLTEELSTKAPHGTLLAMHHPPIPSVLALAALVELRGQDSLEQVIRGSDVRSIISGHLHYSSMALFAGVPVSAASATCYTQDLNVAVGGSCGRDGAQSFNMVHIYRETVLHSVVPAGRYPAVSYISPTDAAKTLAQAEASNVGTTSLTVES